MPIPSGRLFESILGGFDGGVICFRVYLEQLALALKLTKPALQLLVVPCPQTHQATLHESLAGAAESTSSNSALVRLSILSWLFACVTLRRHSAARL